MSAQSVRIEFKISFPVILIAVILLHALFLAVKGLPDLTLMTQKDEPRTPLQIRDIRTVGARESRIKDSAYLSKSPSKTKEISEKVFSKNSSQNNVSVKPKETLSLKDLSATKAATSRPQVRPGTRPEVIEKKAISGISLKGSQIQQFAKYSNAATLSGDPRAQSLSNSDILVNLEVPEGVNPDELNKYELMFYGFQRRTAMNYINSFYKNLDKFQRENPHLNFPMTETKQVMTGRLTYDEKGNIKKISMVRWTNVDRLQDFFVDVLKDMDTLHNPPQALWEKSGEFSIFFSLVING